MVWSNRVVVFIDSFLMGRASYAAIGTRCRQFHVHLARPIDVSLHSIVALLANRADSATRNRDALPDPTNSRPL